MTENPETLKDGLDLGPYLLATLVYVSETRRTAGQKRR
jgi:hypothetical protein